MDDQGPDPKAGSSPNSARVEDDIVRALRPRKNPSRLRLPAALPFAIAGILVVSSIAFGANVMSSIVTPNPSATPVVVGDDDPTDAPTLVPTEAPSAVVSEAPIVVVTDAPTEAPTAVPTKAPTAVPIKAPTKAPTKTNPPAANPADLGALRVTDNGNGKYTFNWNAYTGGTEFSYYKLSGVPSPGAPGYAETGKYWTYVGPGTTSATYEVPAGTWNVNIEAIYYPSGKTTALAKTSTINVVVAGSTKTAPPVADLMLTLGDVIPNTSAPTSSVHLSWTKYTGPYFGYYGIVRTEGTSQPTLSVGQVPTPNFDSVNSLTWTDTSAKAGHTYHYKLWAFTDQTFASGVFPNCTVGTILAASNIVDVTITVPTPPESAAP